MELDRKQLAEAAKAVITSFGPRADSLALDEFRYNVLERLMLDLGLPFTELEDIGEVPDFKDDRVRELDQALSEQKETLRDILRGNS